jgi:hypothetical protein
MGRVQVMNLIDIVNQETFCSNIFFSKIFMYSNKYRHYSGDARIDPNAVITLIVALTNRKMLKKALRRSQWIPETKPQQSPKNEEAKPQQASKSEEVSKQAPKKEAKSKQAPKSKEAKPKQAPKSKDAKSKQAPKNEKEPQQASKKKEPQQAPKNEEELQQLPENQEAKSQQAPKNVANEVAEIKGHERD